MELAVVEHHQTLGDYFSGSTRTWRLNHIEPGCRPDGARHDHSSHCQQDQRDNRPKHGGPVHETSQALDSTMRRGQYGSNPVRSTQLCSDHSVVDCTDRGALQ